jgi:hypothetical protein
VRQVPGFIAQLRAAADGDDEALKQSILAGFAPQYLEKAAAEAEQKTSSVDIREQSQGLAATPLAISNPQDAAELEAVRVSEAVVSGGGASINIPAHPGIIHRNGGAAAALAALTLTEAEFAPAEVATGPPGWVVGGVVLLAIAGLAIYVAATSSSTTTTLPVPTTGTRTRPGQTCDDIRLAALTVIKDAACAVGFSCSDDFEGIGKKREKLLTCPELLARIAAARACILARNNIQSECFAGSPEAGHAIQIAQLTAALNTCLAKAAARGC